MKVEAIDHVQLAMPRGREDDARAFYRDLLGIPEVAKPSNLAKRGGVWFERGSLRVHLGVDSAFSPARKAHPAFVVTGLAELVETLTESGFKPSEEEPLEGYAPPPLSVKIRL